MSFYEALMVLYLSISIALLSAWAIQKQSRPQHWYCVRVNTSKRYRQLRVKDLPKVVTKSAAYFNSELHQFFQNFSSDYFVICHMAHW